LATVDSKVLLKAKSSPAGWLKPCAALRSWKNKGYASGEDDSVEKITGNKARTVESWITENLSAFRKTVDSPYALHYFNARGRGELTRLAFAVGGIKYNDIRYDSKEWVEKKASGIAPFGQMPYLTVTKDGKETVIAQGQAIARYAAALGKLYGANELEGAQIDMILGGITDVVGLLVPIAHGISDPEEKKTKLGAFIKEVIPGWVNNFEKILLKNEKGEGYFVGKSITLADLCVYAFFENVIVMNKDVFANNKTLGALYERVAKNEKVAAWFKVRPVTMF